MTRCRAGLKPIGPIAPNWAPCPVLQTLVQVDWGPGPTEIVPNWTPRPILQTLVQVDWEPGPTDIVPNWTPRPILQTLVQVDWGPGPTDIVPNWAPHLLRLGHGKIFFNQSAVGMFGLKVNIEEECTKVRGQDIVKYNIYALAIIFIFDLDKRADLGQI